MTARKKKATPPGPPIEMSAAAAQVRQMVAKTIDYRASRRTYTFSKSKVAAAQKDFEARAAAGNWAGAGPASFVALYVWAHCNVYGVEPAEMNGHAWAFASSAAKKLLDSEFGGDATQMVQFMKWVWRREEGREKWRVENGRDAAGRITWRTQFTASYLITDYRISMQRAGRR
jgi:hypothetical protein